MKEKHFAYKITNDTAGIVCTSQEFEEDKMRDLLIEIRDKHTQGLYWIFKQRNGTPQEALAIIDCEKNRIYFHYSGEVETITEAIEKLSKDKR